MVCSSQFKVLNSIVLFLSENTSQTYNKKYCHLSLLQNTYKSHKSEISSLTGDNPNRMFTGPEALDRGL